MNPKILFGTVMHKRLFPRVNKFQYGIYYMALPLSKLGERLNNRYFKYERFGLLSFYNKDHGNRDGGDLLLWARNLLKQNKIIFDDGEIILVTMPRVFGYVFNPISFYYCYDADEKLRAVICEVNNTFGEGHIYVCTPDDNDEFLPSHITKTVKMFHVSPFMEREGHYDFQFKMSEKSMVAMIDYFDKDNQKKLITSLKGGFSDFNQDNCSRAFWRYPLVTLKSIMLIHWQALKLVVKRIKYIPKPDQMANRITISKNKGHNNP